MIDCVGIKVDSLPTRSERLVIVREANVKSEDQEPRKWQINTKITAERVTDKAAFGGFLHRQIPRANDKPRWPGGIF